MREVFGITGTNGKTTTSYMLEAILEGEGKSCALIGTVTHRIGGKAYEAVNTTPGKELLREYFSEMDRQDMDCCIMEISSHGLHQGRVSEIPIKYAAFTNLSQDHLDYHKTMEEYYWAKRKLFDFDSLMGAIINSDDPYGRRLTGELKKEWGRDKKVWTLSLVDRESDIFGEIKGEGFWGTEFEIFIKGCGKGVFTIPLPGRYQVYNCLTAVGLALLSLGEGHMENMRKALADFKGAPGRFEIITNKNKDIFAVCDYAHTPDALRNLLETVGQIKETQPLTKRGRVITVFGCGGGRDRGKRPVMGEIAGELSDYCIITSDNPRNENPEDIICEIEEGIYGTGCDYSVMTERYQAIKRAALLAGRGDIIIIAGKGHETYQIKGNKKEAFDDRKLIRELL